MCRRGWKLDWDYHSHLRATNFSDGHFAKASQLSFLLISGHTHTHTHTHVHSPSGPRDTELLGKGWWFPPSWSPCFGQGSSFSLKAVWRLTGQAVPASHQYPQDEPLGPPSSHQYPQGEPLGPPSAISAHRASLLVLQPYIPGHIALSVTSQFFLFLILLA